VVICFGTLFTLPLIITILPVAYTLAFENKKRQNVRPLMTVKFSTDKNQEQLSESDS